MDEHTAVLTDILNQRWCHGIWVVEAPMTDECIVLTENEVQKAKSLYRVTPKEKFLISELENGREFPWNDVAENLKLAIETHQDQDSSGHRRMRPTIKIVLRIGATPGCSCCAGSRSHTEACRVRSQRILADAKESEFESGRSRNWIDCKNDRGAPTTNSCNAARTFTIIIFQSFCADARSDSKHSERADGLTEGNGITGTQRAKESATE